MNRQETEQRNITIYWWNMGKKTLDHKGTYKEYLNSRDIKVRTINHPYAKIIKTGTTQGLRFEIPTSSSVARLDAFDYPSYIESYNKAILIFLAMMGDKALFIDGYGRKYQINWR